MAKYTAELREYFGQYQDGTLNTKDLIEKGRTQLFNFDYPIYDNDYKKVFETHFIRKFYLREIGYETFGLFKFQLETWLLINMPYFNKMFESELLEFDPLTNSKMDATYTKRNDKSQNDETSTAGNKTSNLDTTKTGTTSGTSDVSTQQTHDESANASNTTNKSEDMNTTEDDFNRDIESDNPDTRLQLTANDGQGVIEYANKIKEQNTNNNKTQSNSGTSDSTSNSTNSSNDNVNTSQNSNATSNETDNTTMDENDSRNSTLVSTINDIEDYIQHRVGKIGVQSYPKMIQEYREALLRIEATIFDEMNQLFMLVY